jgi:molybdate transport system substrate-binding protein
VTHCLVPSVLPRRVLAASALLALLPLTACGGWGGDTTITVLAASSLTGTFTELGQAFEDEHPGVTVKFAFDSSATLAQQAAGGAPADVLATADTTTMDSATSALASAPKGFATNVMVLVTPKDNPAGITSFSDLNSGKVTYVVCVDTAPCGKVAAALLQQDTITAAPASTEIDVKSVLAKVTEGEADAGIVYTTDSVAAGDAVTTWPIPGTEQQTTTYPIATLDQSKEPTLAQDFVDLVLSSQGQQVLHDAGFGAPR